jgi:hypothetical protein
MYSRGTWPTVEDLPAHVVTESVPSKAPNYELEVPIVARLDMTVK